MREGLEKVEVVRGRVEGREKGWMEGPSHRDSIISIVSAMFSKWSRLMDSPYSAFSYATETQRQAGQADKKAPKDQHL